MHGGVQRSGWAWRNFALGRAAGCWPPHCVPFSNSLQLVHNLSAPTTSPTPATPTPSLPNPAFMLAGCPSPPKSRQCTGENVPLSSHSSDIVCLLHEHDEHQGTQRGVGQVCQWVRGRGGDIRATEIDRPPRRAVFPPHPDARCRRGEGEAPASRCPACHPQSPRGVPSGPRRLRTPR